MRPAPLEVECRVKFFRATNNVYEDEIYDLVMGAVANDTVTPTIQAFLAGFLNEEATLITLKTSKLIDQICMKSEKSLTLLRFISSYEIRN